MNISKRILGLVLTVSMVSVNAVQYIPAVMQQPIIGTTIASAACIGLVASATAMKVESLTPNSAAGFVITGCGLMCGGFALVAGGNYIAEGYNKLSTWLKAHTPFTAGQWGVGVLLSLLMLRKATLDNDVMSPLKTLWNGITSLTFSTNAVKVAGEVGTSLIEKVVQ